MTDAEPIRIVRPPTRDEARAAVDQYLVAVGRVSYAWNYLQQKLGQLFVFVTGIEARIALAVWYSSRSDATQRNMLRAAIAAARDDKWSQQSPTAKEDLLWLVDRASALAEHRNNAIHIPASLMTDHEGPAMRASLEGYINGHPLARRLWGKELLSEFALCETEADALSKFAGHAAVSIADRGETAWPGRPVLPDREPKSDRSDQPRPPRTRSRPRRHRSSQA